MDDSLDEAEFGHASCVETSSNGHYCQRWEHIQSEYKKCWFDWISTEEGLVYTEICCNKENRVLYACCNQACSPSAYNSKIPQIEYLTCQCEEPAANGLYCQLWTCEQYSWASQTYAQGREYETYTCLEADPLENYCTRWKGNIHSIEEFEVDKCYCKQASSSGEYCQDWICEEKGSDMWYPNLYWNFLVVILGGLIHAVILFLFLFSEGEWRQVTTKFSYWCFYFAIFISTSLVWCGGFIIIGVWKAGIATLIIGGSIVLVPMLLLFLYALVKLKLHQADAVGCCSTGGCVGSGGTESHVVIVHDDFSPKYTPATREEDVEMTVLAVATTNEEHFSG